MPPEKPSGIAGRHPIKSFVLCSFLSFSTFGLVWIASAITNLARITFPHDCIDHSPPSTQHVVKSSSRRIFTVFNTECIPFHDWQSQTLLYSHRSRKIEGELVRLMSCSDASYVPPSDNYGRYRVVRTPNYNDMFPDDSYTPRNKANAISHWLNGFANDTDLPDDDDVVVVVDPDNIFLSDKFNVSAVRHGHGIAAQYGLGRNWVREKIPFCDGKCDDLEEDYNPSWGVPQIFTAGDTRRHADLWKMLTEGMRRAEKHYTKANHKWMTEMRSSIIAARRLGIQVDVQRMMVSHFSDGEPWENTRWVAPSGESLMLAPGGGELAVPVAHYCEVYMFSSFQWTKHGYRNLDIRHCNQFYFKFPDDKSAEEMNKTRNRPLVVDALTNKSLVDSHRMLWLLDNTYGIAMSAINAYLEDFCQKQWKY